MFANDSEAPAATARTATLQLLIGTRMIDNTQFDR